MKQQLLFIINFIFIFSLNAQEVPKNILLEHFTNSRCTICASKNPDFYSTIENYEKAIHIAYHPSSPYSSCIFSQHNLSGNDNRANELNVFGSTPRVVVNGTAVSPGSNLINTSDLDNQNNVTTPFDIEINQFQVGSDSMYCEVIVKTVSTTNLTNATIFISLAEQTINYAAPNGEDEHYDVFRMFLTSNSGYSFNLPNNGEDTTFVYGVKIDQEWKGEELITTAFLQGDNNEVLQAEQSKSLAFTTGISSISIVNQVMYPNPTRDYLYINNESLSIDKIEMYNILGSKVKEYYLNDIAIGKLNVSNLNEGNYIVRIYEKDNKIHTTKVVVDY